MANEPCFGRVASTYVAYRPAYPPALFEALARAVPPPRRRAIDVGAGTGLVALELCKSFESVIAVEPDERMLAALPSTDPRLMRVCARAEEYDTSPGTIDLVTAGNALHWMDAPVVAECASRWLRPGGVFAAFRYGPPHALDQVEDVLQVEMRERWAAHLHPRLLDEEYSRRSVQSCARFASVDVQTIANVVELTPEDLVGFCQTTSYGSAYVASLADPAAYDADLLRRIREISHGETVPIDFGLELILAGTEPEQLLDDSRRPNR